MDDNTSSQRTGNRDAQSGMAPQWGGWMQDYQAGNYDRLPHEEITRAYRDWSSTATPDQRYEATYQGYQQLPQDQWGSAAEDLYNYCQDQSLDLSDLNLSNSDYRQWNTQDLARVTERAYSSAGSSQGKQGKQGKESKGGGLHVPKPVIGLALAGTLAYAASRFLGGKSDKDQESDSASYSGSPDYTSGTPATFGSRVSGDMDTSGSSIDTSSSYSAGSMGSSGGSSSYSAGSMGSMGSSSGSSSLGSSGSSSGGSSLGSSGSSSGSSLGSSGDYSAGSMGSMGSSSGSGSLGSSGSYDSDTGSSD